MRKVWVVAVREYLAAVRTKSFVVSIILLPILMCGGFIAQTLLRGQADPRPRRFAVIDRTPGAAFFTVLDQAAILHNKRREQPGADQGPFAIPAFALERIEPPADGNLDDLRLHLSERVRTGDLTGILEIGPDVLTPPPGPPSLAELLGERGAARAGLKPPPEANSIRYQTNRPSFQEFPRWAEGVLRREVQTVRAQAKGVPKTELDHILRAVPLVQKGLTARDSATGALREGQEQSPAVGILLPGGLVVLMFMMVLLGAAPLLQGVIEEKMQRIAEVLLGSVPPFQLMLGKLIGMAGMSLTMTLIYLSGIYGMVRHFGYAEYLTAELLVWFIGYQVLAIFMFGSVYAAVGAACSDMKEAQGMMLPVTLVIMLPLFVWINVVREPGSTFATAASFFPPATPMLMLVRQAVPPGIPAWQPWLGVALMLVTTLVCVWVAGRIFRVGILLQGKAPGIRELGRWVLRG